MLMDENTKNELIKRIQEQREAMLKGKPLSNQPVKKAQPNPDSFHQEPKNDVDTLKLNDLISDVQNSEESIETKRSIMSFFRSEGNELSWTKAILIVSILIGAILFGIFLGYLATILESMKKI